MGVGGEVGVWMGVRVRCVRVCEGVWCVMWVWWLRCVRNVQQHNHVQV